MSTNPEEQFIKEVTESQGIIHKVCGIYCDDEEHRKDLFQEILIQLWKSYSSFKGNSKFSTWMYRVSLNVALQHLRKSKRNPKEVVLQSSFDNIPETFSNDTYEEETDLLRTAISHLNEIEKAIIMLHLEEKSNEEIAQIIGITQNYVRVKMNRIKVKLKKIVNPD